MTEAEYEAEKLLILKMRQVEEEQIQIRFDRRMRTLEEKFIKLNSPEEPEELDIPCINE